MSALLCTHSLCFAATDSHYSVSPLPPPLQVHAEPAAAERWRDTSRKSFVDIATCSWLVGALAGTSLPGFERRARWKKARLLIFRRRGGALPRKGVGSASSALADPLIVIDGQNVAFSFISPLPEACARGKLRALGIKIVVDFFKKRGFPVVAVLPAPLLQPGSQKWLGKTIDRADYGVLEELARDGHIVAVPSQDNDDTYMISLALKHKGYVVTNDRFRDFVDDQGKLDKKQARHAKHWVRNHLISFTFFRDEFLPNPNFNFPPGVRLTMDSLPLPASDPEADDALKDRGEAEIMPPSSPRSNLEDSSSSPSVPADDEVLVQKAADTAEQAKASPLESLHLGEEEAEAERLHEGSPGMAMPAAASAVTLEAEAAASSEEAQAQGLSAQEPDTQEAGASSEQAEEPALPLLSDLVVQDTPQFSDLAAATFGKTQVKTASRRVSRRAREYLKKEAEAQGGGANSIEGLAVPHSSEALADPNSRERPDLRARPARSSVIPAVSWL
eukprot:CAMPEP_0178387102 /NCGR_PEP_ID=MMETSP0689_2-20121128/8902_1 /TAXON_ID=160604 /ORGANISM="Amphidinium massartii, Strain CS-259" /LENGTH=502 /DNA_ID=CAMNT_0020007459 /DNA_START=9 /DNA_END=1518 /DNA_ORIENTATION=-